MAFARSILCVMVLVSVAALPAHAAPPTKRTAPYDSGCLGGSGAPSSCVPWPGAREAGLVQAGSAYAVYPYGYSLPPSIRGGQGAFSNSVGIDIDVPARKTLLVGAVFQADQTPLVGARMHIEVWLDNERIVYNLRSIPATRGPHSISVWRDRLPAGRYHVTVYPRIDRLPPVPYAGVSVVVDRFEYRIS